jgi:8-oxo-dGTP diphosphatase
MTHQLVRVAIAILYRDDKFLFQLRDDLPNIVYPAHWGFFGGHLDPGETPHEAVMRELQEEIAYTPPIMSDFGCYSDPRVERHVFHAPLTVELDQLILQEGWDMALLTPAQVQVGSCYSPKADRILPLVPAARQIVLDFLTVMTPTK